MNTTFKKNMFAMVIGFSLITAFSQSAIARPGGGGPGGGGTGGPEQNNQAEPDAASILNRMDYDGSGEVTVEDFINRGLERAEQHFDRLDSDDDGVISEAENTAMPDHENNSDIDHDALKLCIEETTGIALNDRPSREETFALTDVDGDGFVSFDEFTNERAAHISERFAELDSSGDGAISEDEVSATITERQLIDSARQSCINEQLLLDESNTSI